MMDNTEIRPKANIVTYVSSNYVGFLLCSFFDLITTCLRVRFVREVGSIELIKWVLSPNANKKWARMCINRFLALIGKREFDIKRLSPEFYCSRRREHDHSLTLRMRAVCDSRV